MVRDNVTRKEGIDKSSFFEAINTRGLEQLLEVFKAFPAEARTMLPKEHSDLGDLIVIN
ncbi:MAG: hypothetical protein ABIN18_29305 [Pseudomonadota bacterium]